MPFCQAVRGIELQNPLPPAPTIHLMALADYLAKNYLTADPKPERKSKKRKRKDASSGLVIADDDALGWNPHNITNADDDTPLTGQFDSLPKIRIHHN